ncbi:MAG: response regulator [Myxococcota bacterium]|nr:response regulator [Myxococcota bacterium]
MTRKLLLADPSPVIQGLVERGLAAHDFELICAETGEDALAMARSLLPDIVLADVTLAELDGYRLCEAIKGNSELAGVPVLLLSGAFDPYDPERAQTSGADDHIQKPFESETLIKRFTAALARAGSEGSVDPLQRADLDFSRETRGASSRLESRSDSTLIGEELILADELGFDDEGDLLEILPLPKEEPTQSDAFEDIFDFGDSALEASPRSQEAESVDPGNEPAPEADEENRGRLHEALKEKAADALSDYPEAVVETLIARVEAIAWEVIPQMAEALIREEIRRMKTGKE